MSVFHSPAAVSESIRTSAAVNVPRSMPTASGNSTASAGFVGISPARRAAFNLKKAVG